MVKRDRDAGATQDSVDIAKRIKVQPDEVADVGAPSDSVAAKAEVSVAANTQQTGKRLDQNQTNGVNGANQGHDEQDREPGSEDDRILLPRSTTRSAVKRGHECPYLDTISRQASAQIWT